MDAAHKGEAAESPEQAQQAITDLVELNANRRELVRLYTVLAAEALAPEHPAHDYFASR